MHFIKTVISIFALSSFTAAELHGAERDAAIAARDIAYEDLLLARDEYIEKRDLLKRLGDFGKGNCVSPPHDSKVYSICQHPLKKRPCGGCKKGAYKHKQCDCEY